MSNKNNYKSSGTLTLKGKKLRGELIAEERLARFVTKKQVIELPYPEIAVLKNVRNGGMASTITIKMMDGTEFVFYLPNGLKVYHYMDQLWDNRPRSMSHADELHRLAELRGERIEQRKGMTVQKAVLITLWSGIFGTLFRLLLGAILTKFAGLAFDISAIGTGGALGWWIGYKIVSAKRRKPNRSLGGDIGIYVMLALVACLMAFPLVFAVSSALKPLDELFRFPPTIFPQHPTTDNFSDLIVTMGQSWVPFSRYILNTVFITAVGTFGHLVIASMAAFVLAKYDFPGGRLFFAVVTTALMFSGYVTGIPNYVIMSKLNMIDTYWALLLPAFAAPIGLFMMKQFMEGLPTALIEAAKIDGAKEFRIFWSIVMPNVKPAWLTVIIFSVQSLWNTSASTVIYSEAKKTLVYALQQIQAGGIARTGQAAAVTVVVMAVPIFIFVLSQSQILETMASSGIKD